MLAKNWCRWLGEKLEKKKRKNIEIEWGEVNISAIKTAAHRTIASQMMVAVMVAVTTTVVAKESLKLFPIDRINTGQHVNCGCSKRGKSKQKSKTDTRKETKKKRQTEPEDAVTRL